MKNSGAIEIRNAVFAADIEAVKRLWFDYLTWGNDEMRSRDGVHPHSPPEAVDHDVASLAKYQPPDGRLVLAICGGVPCGIGCLRATFAFARNGRSTCSSA